ncbi:MAG: biotin--[acetyl-CoA-carboxylase] ligase [Omnitrophica bacterium RIFCSPHIGHO2_02_FULL_51_18]|nr:MAG: biotin--[acetyl-CoA-carboxylase] ligase [Omnitrophica bacterium RIFCSPHIGHO2_02_FULL_51_18]
MAKDSAVLKSLRDQKGQFVSGEEISKKLKVSRSAVWKEIQVLKNLGYEIGAGPHLGYRLLGIPDRMLPDELSAGIKTKFIGRQIISYEETRSTNDAVFHLGEEGLKEGVCVFAEHQTQGRGRLGRAWVSPKYKNILFSVLLRPDLSPAGVSKVTLMAAVSVVKTLRLLTGRRFHIKWPNDVLFHEKKLCGILTEMSSEPDRVNFIVVGIGINVNADPGELVKGATSLKEITGTWQSRIEISQTLLETFESDYLQLKKGEFEALAKKWEEFSSTSGKRVTATVLGRKIHGTAVGIDKEGALWIRTDSGLQEKILAGDVQHEK